MSKQLARVRDRMWRFIGDNQGWIYSDKELQCLDRDDMHYWSADFNLQVPCPVRPTLPFTCKFLILPDYFHVGLWNPCPVRVLSFTHTIDVLIPTDLPVLVQENSLFRT